MEPIQTPRQKELLCVALTAVKELGFSNIMIVDDTKENLVAADTCRGVLENAGISLNLFAGVDEFESNVGALEKKGHSLVLTDFVMPSRRTYLGHENCAAIAVIDTCLASEVPGRINFPIVISHGGQGHGGQVVELCFGNHHFQISDFPLGKADPRLWEKALREICSQLKSGEAKSLFDVRVRVNELNPFTSSIMTDDTMKLGYIPHHILQRWMKG